MQVKYVLNSRFPTEKAHGGQIAYMCAALADLGAEVTLIIPFRFQPKEFSLRSDPFTYYGLPRCFEIARLWTPDLIPLERYFGAYIFKYVINAQLALSGLAGALSFYAWQSRPTFCYTRDMWSAFWLDRLGLPFVYEEAHYRRPSSPSMRLILRVTQNSPLRLFAVPTERLFVHYQKAGVPKTKLLLLPNGIHLARFREAVAKDVVRCRLGLLSKKVVIGYLGKFETMGVEKGIRTAITALGRLSKSVRNKVVAIFAGGPAKRIPEYEDLARQEGVSDLVNFYDHIEPTLVPSYLQAFDVGLIPYPTSFHFNRSLKVYEYMAAQLPIVASDLAGLREVLTDGRNALLVPPEDPLALARALERLVLDPELCRTLAAQAFQDVRIFTWERRAKTVLESWSG
jgi:glycosyltransferase involved in cell wall biosynthesis